jgi:hypothetical protein
MSGFAVIYAPSERIEPPDPLLAGLATAVADFKCLDQADCFVSGRHGAAAKLNSAAALHRAIVRDEASGSWLLAAGTVIDRPQPAAAGQLQQLLTDYLEQGAAVLARLDGHFALILYDGRDDTLLAVSDPFGIISLFVGQANGRYFISTSALAIAKTMPAKLSELGVRFFLASGNVLGEMTLWQDIKRLPPATVLRLSRENAAQSSYWSLELDPTVAGLSCDQAVEAMIEVLSSQTQQSLHREGPVWLSLTGGFDSRTLAMLASRAGIPFKSYCHGPPESADVRLARHISQQMAWDYEYFPPPDDWGQARAQWLSRTLGQSDAHLGLLKTSRIVREQSLKAQQYPVSLWGFGGEIYRGYYWKQEFFRAGTSSTVNYDRLFGYRLGASISQPLLNDNSRWLAEIRAEHEGQIKRIGERNPAWLNTAKLDLIGTHLEGTVHGGAHISAVLGVQRAIAPFYFKEGMRRVISLNYRWRRYNRLFRLMLERVNPKLAGIETADGGPALPMRANNLYKFAPYWLTEGKRLLWGAGYRFLGVQLWDKARNVGSSYPLDPWRLETLAALKPQALLEPARMHSANLYDPVLLPNFLQQAETAEFKHEGLLSRILTVEMACRAVGASL